MVTWTQFWESGNLNSVLRKWKDEPCSFEKVVRYMNPDSDVILTHMIWCDSDPYVSIVGQIKHVKLSLKNSRLRQRIDCYDFVLFHWYITCYKLAHLYKRLWYAILFQPFMNENTSNCWNTFTIHVIYEHVGSFGAKFFNFYVF